jgi:hypothetical protein
MEKTSDSSPLGDNRLKKRRTIRAMTAVAILLVWVVFSWMQQYNQVTKLHVPDQFVEEAAATQEPQVQVVRHPDNDLDPRLSSTNMTEMATFSNTIPQIHATESTDMAHRVSSLDLDPRLNYTNIFWLHIEKTGTSFFNTIFYHFCPKAMHSGRKLPMMDVPIVEEFPPDQWCNVSFYNLPCPGCHHPFKERKEKFLTFTMLRHPAERLRSAFAFGRHGSRSQNTSFLLFDDYVKEPNIPNCQIKMVLGYGCHEKVEESKMNVSMALERVQNPLFFFGITDRWDESICLFHYWFGGSRQPFEVKNNRPTKRNKDDRVTIIQQPPADLDTVFVEGAMEIFEERLKETNCSPRATI